MIIEKLVKYAKEAKGSNGKPLLGDTAFRDMKVDYVIKVKANGQCLNISSSEKKYQCPVVGDRASEKQAGLLCDTAPYVFGNGLWSIEKKRDGTIKTNNTDKHRQNRKTFLTVLRNARKEFRKNPAIRAAIRFCLLSDTERAQTLETHKIKPKSGIRFAFEIESDNGRLAFESKELKDYWRKHTKNRASQRSAGVENMPCLSCGEMRPPAKTHEITIKPIPGGHKKGCKLISFDKPAFRSHGLEQSLNAPMCQECVEAYCLGLNNLLQGKMTRYWDSAAKIVYAFWSKGQTEFDLNATLIEALPEHLRKLYQSPYNPHNANVISSDDTDAFYILALSASGVRAVIRDWSETHLSTVQINIRRWFDDLAIILDRPWPSKKDCRANPGEIFGKFPLRRLIQAIGVKKEKGYEVKLQLGAALFKAAVYGEPLHESILVSVLRRIHLEGDLPPARAALLRLMLTRIVRGKDKGGNEMSETLKENSPDSAYVCGRLLAVLEKLQYHALGPVNASVIDRFFGAASTAPRIVFPRLIRAAEHHLGKLRGEKPGLAVNMQKDLEAVASKLGSPDIWAADFPPVLDLEAQGRFALGFYHQRAAYRSKQNTNKAEKAVEKLSVN